MPNNATELRSWGARGTAGVSFAATLEFAEVSVHLGGRVVLDQFSLRLEPGEIVCLLGESGSGKSTALRVAAGIQPVHAGALLINGQTMSAPGTNISPDKRGIGLMFQDFALFPHLTVLQNVLFGLRRLGRSAALARARAALHRVGLSAREADYPHMLSGGQQQRSASARSVAPRPAVLLLDEPFSSLDARLRETVREETLAVLRETHATSPVVTHDPEEAMVMGDRVALLRHGRIAQIGTAAEIYRHPVDLSAALLFSAQRNRVHRRQWPRAHAFGPCCNAGPGRWCSRHHRHPPHRRCRSIHYRPRYAGPPSRQARRHRHRYLRGQSERD
ncbi:ABC transporter ATP-binding protein [Devosia sp. A8/3-2]|nr:ABC transporter ATP-binding protein [Devosia sp. A8/3-2]